MADVEIRGAEKSFGSTPVLRGVSISIQDGEFLVLVGPSGCGKSTLLRMVAGLESFSKGDLRIGGRVMTDVPPKSRDIAMVFQNYALYPHMTVGRNMGFSLELKHASRQERLDKVQRAAEILDLGPLLGRYPRQLSGGQRQRVAMGRAIVRDPSLFLFDEPLSNLDAKLRVAMRTEIKALHRRLGATIIYVTHDQIEAMTMADRIAVMNGGRVEQLGTPLDLYDHPANLFVATFIGSPSMNLIEGTVVAEGAGRRFRTRSGDVFDLARDLPTGVESRDVVLGVRPERLVLSPTGLDGTVFLVEPMGSETQVLLESPGQRLVMMQRDRSSLRVGQKVSVLPQAEGLHFFDRATGAAMR